MKTEKHTSCNLYGLSTKASLRSPELKITQNFLESFVLPSVSSITSSSEDLSYYNLSSSNAMTSHSGHLAPAAGKMLTVGSISINK